MSATSYFNFLSPPGIDKKADTKIVFSGASWAESGTSRNQNAKVDWCKVISQISLKLVSLSKPSSAENKCCDFFERSRRGSDFSKRSLFS